MHRRLLIAQELHWHSPRRTGPAGIIAQTPSTYSRVPILLNPQLQGRTTEPLMGGHGKAPAR